MPWPNSNDYNEAIQNPAFCFEDAELKRGRVAKDAKGLPRPCAGNFADVYKVSVGDSRVWAVKCFTKEVADLQRRYKAISDHLTQAQQEGCLPFMVEFSYLERGILVKGRWYPLLKMRWVKGELLNVFVQNHLDKPESLVTAAATWRRLSRDLLAAKIAHGDLQHGNVLIAGDEKDNKISLNLIDYDGMFVPALKQLNANELGHPNFQHIMRMEEPYHLEVDRFSHLVIYVAIRCLAVGGRGLWVRYDNGDNLLFREQDLKDPGKSPLFQELWNQDDPTAKALAGRLLLACITRPGNVPSLDEVVDDEGHATLNPGEVDQVEQTLRAGRDYVKPPPGAVLPSLESAATEAPWWMPNPSHGSLKGGAAVPVHTPRDPCKGCGQALSAGVTACPCGAFTNGGGVSGNTLPTPTVVPPSAKTPNPTESPCKGCGQGTNYYMLTCHHCGHTRWTLLWGFAFSAVGLFGWALRILVAARVPVGGLSLALTILLLGGALLCGAIAIRGIVEVKRSVKKPNRRWSHILKGMLGGLVAGAVFSSCCCGLPSLAIVEEFQDSVQEEDQNPGPEPPVIKPEPPVIKHASPVIKRASPVIKVGTPVIKSELSVLKGHTGEVRSVAWSPDGTCVLTGSTDKSARVWDAESGEEMALLDGHTDSVVSVSWSPDGKRVLSGSMDKTAQVRDAGSGEEMALLKGHTDRVVSVAWSPDGKRVLTASVDKTARVWDAESGQEKVLITGHTGEVRSVAWSPDGKRVLTGSMDKTARVWNAETGQEKALLKGHSAGVESVAWSPDGKRVLTGSADKTARVWDAETGQEKARLTGHTGEVRSVAWSPDGKRVLTGSGDGTARVWDAESGQEKALLKGHTGAVESVAWSPDGKRVLTGSADKTARVWGVGKGRDGLEPRGDVLDDRSRRVNRNYNNPFDERTGDDE